MKYLYLAMVVVGALYFYQTAQGYTHTGFKFNHLNITYSCGSPELQQAVQEWASVSALTDGGCSDTPDITLTIVPNVMIPPPVQGYGGAGHIWLPERAAHHYGILLHESGHAIGLGHSAESFTAPYIQRNAAMFAYCCNPMNEDDIAGIVALYGPEPPGAIIPRAYLPGVSR